MMILLVCREQSASSRQMEELQNSLQGVVWVLLEEITLPKKTLIGSSATKDSVGEGEWHSGPGEESKCCLHDLGVIIGPDSS